MTHLKNGTWLRDRETGEAVKIVAMGGMIRYQNADVDGEVQQEKLEDHFKILQTKPVDADDNF